MKWLGTILYHIPVISWTKTFITNTIKCLHVCACTKRNGWPTKLLKALLLFVIQDPQPITLLCCTQNWVGCDVPSKHWETQPSDYKECKVFNKKANKPDRIQVQPCNLSAHLIGIDAQIWDPRLPLELVVQHGSELNHLPENTKPDVYVKNKILFLKQ